MEMRHVRATRVVASTLGVLVGLAGIDHGIFEILQGHVAPGGLMIDAIGPAQRFWEHGTETALTIVPSFLLTGILAVVVGLLVTLWAAAFVHKKYGGGILMLLSIVLFLVGGGFAPIFVAVLASLTATRINKPLTWWRARLPNGVRNALAKVWLWSLIAFVFVFLTSVEIAILGWPLTLWFDADTAFNLLNTVAYGMLALMLFSIVTALAHDAQVQGEKTGQAEGKERTMSDSILVAYATRYGSTREVAEQVAATLRDSGFEASLQPARQVRTLDGYRAVVLGAPLYMFRWHKDAKRFLRRYRQALAGRPVAIFALGPVHDEEKEYQDARAQLDKQLAQFPWLTPVAIEVLGGVWDPSKLGFPFNVLPALKQIPASDVRDWEAIRAWAAGLATKL